MMGELTPQIESAPGYSARTHKCAVHAPQLCHALGRDLLSFLCKVIVQRVLLINFFPPSSRISIFIVWLFIFSHSWKLIPTVYEAVASDNGLDHDDWPFLVLLAEHVSHLMITTNSAINFLIYLFL
jgi:hypothetical protein